MGKITRVKKEKGFVMLDKFPLQDERLSWKAKGLLAYMLSMPDDWQFYISELHKHAKDGKDSTRSAIKELEKCGYLVIEKNNRDDGKFSKNNYFLYERPRTDTEKPQREIRHGKSATTNTDNTNTDNTNIKEKEQIKNLQPVSEEIKPKDQEKEKQKEKKVARKKEKVEANYPAHFSEHIKKAMDDFIQFRKEMRKPFRSKMSLDRKIKQISDQIEKYGEEIVIQSIDLAITNGWMGTFPESVKKPQTNGKQTNNQNKTFTDIFAEIDERYKQEGFDPSDFNQGINPF